MFSFGGIWSKLLAGLAVVASVAALFFRGKYFKEKAAAREKDRLAQKRKHAREKKATEAVLNGTRAQQEEIDRVKKEPARRDYFNRTDY